MSLGVKPVDLVRGSVVNEKSSDKKNVGFCAYKCVLFSAPRAYVPFRRDFNPVVGLLGV